MGMLKLSEFADEYSSDFDTQLEYLKENDIEYIELSFIDGKNIADLRKSNGMTQEQLAETLGVSSQTVSKWENEVTMPDIMLLPVIAGCFDITVDELYGGRKTIEKRQTIDYDDIPEMLYDAVIDLRVLLLFVCIP